MADIDKKVLIEVDVNGGDGAAGAKQITDALDQTKNSAKDTSTQIKSFKAQLKEATQEALKLQLAGKENTKEWIEATKRVAELKDQQLLFSRALESFDPGNKFQGLSKVAGLATQSIAGLQGGLVALGLSSDTANESIAKLQGLQAIIGLIDTIGDAGDYLKPLIANLQGAKVAGDAVAVSTEAQTVATNAQTVATQGATVATKALGTAFKAIGIGLLVAAIAYLVSNFDEIKASVLKLIPSLEGAGETFNKVKNIVIGVGNVVVQYLIAPIKSLIALVQGDFKGAMAAMTNGLNFVKNFKQGQRIGEANDAEAFRKEQLQKEFDDTKDRIEILKARGKSTEALERANYKRSLELAGDDAKKKKEVIQDLRVFEAGVAKKKQDDADKAAKEAAEKQKQADAKRIEQEKKTAEEIKKVNETIKAAQKVISDSSKSDRKKEADDIKASYQEKINEAIKYGQDVIALQDALAVGLAASRKKNDELEAKAKKEAADKIRDEEAKRFKDNADAKLIETENEFRPNENDSPDVAVKKLESKANAVYNIKQAIFDREKAQLAGNKEAIRLLEAQHQKDLTDDEEANAEARKAILQKEKDAKLALYDAIGAGAVAVSDIVGRETVAGKALAVAGALISTYSAIAGQLSAFSKVPIPGYAIAQSVVTGLAGFAAIKNILSVKVPAKGGSGVTGQALRPPTINSTVLNKANNGTGDLQASIDNQKTEPVKAYIVNKDLQNQNQKDTFLKGISTI